MREPVAREPAEVTTAARAPQQVELQAGSYSATVSCLGAALARLTYDGRPLVLDSRRAADVGEVPQPGFSGAVLAPWPNRIRDGRYTFAGRTHQLPVTETGRGCALHGLLLWQHWAITASSATSVTMHATVWPQPGYPFTLDVTATYELSGAGLTVRLGATNTGASAAPVGLSIHPYLVPGCLDGVMDEWTLTLPMTTVLEVDPDRLLPRSTRDVAGTGFDFRTHRLLSGANLDHAFTDAIERRASLHGPDGFGVAVSWDDSCRWVQVCTIDAVSPAWRRSGLALEPMSCPPDAFNSGTDLWTLEPAETRGVAMSVAAAGV